ncbi:unnamed protein product [Urochloa decumbens]|uniref:Uncharacterized protein n=1 Tax=Urochloa decumbens TaxID=240449 RepID=A0ABC8YPJ7_9POAL
MTTLPFIPPFCAFAFVGLETGHGNPRQALRTAESGDDIAYSRLEEGSYVPVPLPQPRIQRRSHATRTLCKIFIRCLATVFGIGMVACLFVWRYLYHDPELQDPLHMIVLAIVGLGGMAFGFLITQDDEDPDM